MFGTFELFSGNGLQKDSIEVSWSGTTFLRICCVPGRNCYTPTQVVSDLIKLLKNCHNRELTCFFFLFIFYNYCFPASFLTALIFSLCCAYSLGYVLFWRIKPARSSQARSGWTAIFRSLQSCSIQFQSRLWRGHSRTFTELFLNHSCIVLLEDEPLTQSEVLDQVFVKGIAVPRSIQLSLNPDQYP